MSIQSTNTKRIAQNTLFLYFRMLFLMFVSFYTSRVVLEKLGVVDFGIHNVVGGLASMFVFFRSSLANVTQRYLNIELGNNEKNNARNVFRQHQTLYIVISILVLLCAETIGLWFVSSQLNIPIERRGAALWVYQFTIISLVLTILSVVYDATIIAHEDMKIYSYVGIVEGLCKLAIAFIISFISYDKLVTYSFLLTVVAVSVIAFYSLYCSNRYEECRFAFVWNTQNVREVFSMITWNTIGTAVYAINHQGIDVLLNLFFGPAINAAKGIASQIGHAINNFGSNFYVAVRPQIVKSYSARDFDYLHKLFFGSSKYSVFLLWFLCLPVMLCINYILNLWLKVVPEHTDMFAILIMVFSVVNVLNNPIWSLALAVGQLKWYIVIGSGVFLLAFPISYVCLKMGCPPETVLVVNILVRIVYIFVVINVINKYIPISMRKYLSDILLPVLMVITLSGGLGWFCSSLLPVSFTGRFLTCVICLCITLGSIWSVGLKKEERAQLRVIIVSKLKNRRKDNV